MIETPEEPAPVLTTLKKETLSSVPDDECLQKAFFV
jgi:hypothetical protein